MTLPMEILPGEVIDNIGGESAMSVKLPHDIRPGERVILIASYPRGDGVDQTKPENSVCNEKTICDVGSACKLS